MADDRSNAAASPDRARRPAATRRGDWWWPSYSLSGLVHALVLIATLAVPLVALRGERAQRLPSVPELARLQLVEPVRWIVEVEPVHEFAPVELPEPEVVDEPLPERVEPLEDPRSFPVEAGFVRRANDPPAFPHAERLEPPQPEAPTEPSEPVAESTQPAPESPLETVGSTSDELAPELIEERSPRPRYPELAQRMGWEGAVICRITVDATGSVVAVALERSSGHPALDKAALAGVWRWRFRPGRRGGVPVTLDVRKRVLFRLES